jgi:hypothetical protein
VGLDINEIAVTAATALASAMASDAWSTVRVKLAALLGHGDTSQEQEALADLDHIRASNGAASPPGPSEEEVRVIAAELRGHLKSRLRSDPQLAAELQVLTEEILHRLPARDDRPTVSQDARAKGGSTVIQAGGNVHHGRF